MAEEEIGLIHGRTPDSKEEWYVSLALDRLEVPYDYQYILISGGIVGAYQVDFVVFNPWSIPCEVMGRYWHNPTTDPDTRFRLDSIKQYFNRDVILWWDDRLKDKDMAYQTVKKDLGL